MDITFKCGHCGQSLVVEEGGAGETVPCPTCGHGLTILQNQTAKHPLPVRDFQEGVNTALDKQKKTVQRGVLTSPMSLSATLLVIAVIVGGFFVYSLWDAHQRASTFFAAANEIISEGRKLREAVSAGAGYDSYVEHLVAFNVKVHDLPYTSASSEPDKVRVFLEQIDKAQRNYSDARILWKYSDSERSNKRELLLDTAGSAIGEARFQLSKLGVTDFLFPTFR